jgi:hypothetical protein
MNGAKITDVGRMQLSMGIANDMILFTATGGNGQAYYDAFTKPEFIYRAAVGANFYTIYDYWHLGKEYKKIMIYSVKNNFDKWVENYQKQLFKTNVYSILLMLFVGLAIFFGTEGGLNNDKIFGLSGVVIIMLFFLYTYIRAGSIFNRTIKEIEINELDVVLKTYGFKLFGLIMFSEKNVTTEYKGLRFSLNEFPLKENKKALTMECYLLFIKEVEYYLLHNDFENSLI